MRLQFQFNYQETDVYYSVEKDDEGIFVIAEELAKLVGKINTLYPEAFRANGEDEDLGYDEVQSRTCPVCDREFKTPANRKQHQTVQEHHVVTDS